LKPKAQYQEEVKMCAVSALNGWEDSYGKWKPLEKATIQYVAVWKHSKRGPLPDPDNVVAAMKCALDSLTARERGNGVVGAGVIVDDRDITMLTPCRGRADEEEMQIIVRDTK
jgi:hypothetical protein